MTLVAWARYHLIGRKKRTRTLVNAVILVFLLSVVMVRNARRSSSSSKFYFDMPLSELGSLVAARKATQQRILPMTESTLMADWIYNSSTGSFWLPQPPKEPISGYESRMEGNQFQTKYFQGRSGFMHPDKIDIGKSTMIDGRRTQPATATAPTHKLKPIHTCFRQQQ